MWTPDNPELLFEFEQRQITTPVITFVLPPEETSGSSEGGTPAVTEPEIFTVELNFPNLSLYPDVTKVGTQLIGIFKDVFDPSIMFVTEDQKNIFSFTKFSQAAALDGNIFSYQPDPRDTKRENMTAVATGNRGTIYTKEYYVTIRNDRDIGRLQLIEAVRR